ncbi:MAG: zinc ABC transporter substrate-binding protein [Halanaerobiales bacterium]
MLSREYRLIFAVILLIFAVITTPKIVKAEEVTTAVTILPQKQFIEAVTGGSAEIAVMIPPGYSPGNYAPRPSELTKFSDADIYFSIGVPADIQNILPKVKQFNQNIKIVRLAEKVAKKYEDKTYPNGSRDPHIWLSPKRVIYIVQIIRDELIELNPAKEELYKKNTKQYIEKVKEVNQKIEKIISEKENKYLLVYHPSFGYFADQYNLNMVAIEEGGKEATAKHLQEIIDFAKKNNIKKIFHQAEIDSRQTQALSEEIGAELIELDPLAEDYLDNLIKMANKIVGDE